MSFVTVGVTGVRKGTAALVVPLGEAFGRWGGLCGKDGVGGCREVRKELGGSGLEGWGVCDDREGVGAEVGSPSITEEGVDLPAEGGGGGQGVRGGGKREEKTCMVRADRVVEGDCALHGVKWVAQECVIHEDVIDERRAGARSPVGDGALWDCGDQSQSIKPCLKLVVPAGGGNIWGRPEGRMCIKIATK